MNDKNEVLQVHKAAMDGRRYAYPRKVPNISPPTNEAVEFLKGFSGADMLDYFAARAPDIPGWYNKRTKLVRPEMPTPEPEIAEEAREWLKDACYDFADAFDRGELDTVIGKDGLPIINTKWLYKHRPFAEKFERELTEYHNEIKEIEQLEVERRYFSWRWYYAEMMLATKPVHDEDQDPREISGEMDIEAALAMHDALAAWPSEGTLLSLAESLQEAAENWLGDDWKVEVKAVKRV